MRLNDLNRVHVFSDFACGFRFCGFFLLLFVRFCGFLYTLMPPSCVKVTVVAKLTLLRKAAE